MVKQKNLKQLYFILLLNWNDLSENLSFQILFKKIWAGIFFFNWDSLNGLYEAWSYKKKSTKKITEYRKSV